MPAYILHKRTIPRLCALLCTCNGRIGFSRYIATPLNLDLLKPMKMKALKITAMFLAFFSCYFWRVKARENGIFTNKDDEGSTRSKVVTGLPQLANSLTKLAK